MSFADIEEIKPEELIVEEICDEKPIQLIDFEGTTFKLNSEAMNMIRNIEDELIVVSIVGKARTGKSYLMNLLLDNIGKARGVYNAYLVQSRCKG